jgi:hypothetical protein
LALQSNRIGSAARSRPDLLSVSALARAGIIVALLLIPTDVGSRPDLLCEEFRRETMAMFVEQILRRDGVAARAPDQFETSALDSVLSGDCSGRDAL